MLLFHPIDLIFGAGLRERQLMLSCFITPGRWLSPCSTEGEAASTYLHSALPLHCIVQYRTVRKGKDTHIMPPVQTYTLPATVQYSTERYRRASLHTICRLYIHTNCPPTTHYSHVPVHVVRVISLLKGFIRGIHQWSQKVGPLYLRNNAMSLFIWWK